jgi:predicted RNA-binding Zn-ribbon protein involved in translation (DUF1610 family)
MAKQREELEQELFEQAQATIRKLLDGLPEASKITLSDMERATGEMGQAITEQAVQRLVESQQPPLPDAVPCPTCGERMYRRGKRKRRVVTTHGEVDIERQYYVCPSCGAGHFPPG